MPLPLAACRMQLNAPLLLLRPMNYSFPRYPHFFYVRERFMYEESQRKIAANKEDNVNYVKFSKIIEAFLEPCEAPRR